MPNAPQFGAVMTPPEFDRSQSSSVLEDLRERELGDISPELAAKVTERLVRRGSRRDPAAFNSSI
jgi:hypothetical protein